ncbi:pyridoxal phosphate-dependent aminotransferase [Bifidobacterium mongoliense]|uniref:pyridoxal phosphate-dependent aminotransferase n=1 Tax=Bifidobacterium mongoliense TaxID=518643 RepID=UPI0030EE6B99
MRFSSRVDTGNPNPIIVEQRRALAAGEALTSLNDSNPTRHGLAPEGLSSVYRAQPRGPIEARRALARFLTDQDERTRSYRLPAVDPEHLYLLSSTSQAYSWLMKLFCDAGDAVLAPTPGYPLIASIARLENVHALPYQLRFDGSWVIDLAGIAAVLDGPQGDRVRALIVINPNNPTGSYVRPQERAALLDLCTRHGIALIADEVFFDYALEPFPGNDRLAGEPAVLTCGLDGFSKMLAAPHAKVGWIRLSGPDVEVREATRRLDVIADDYLPMSDIIARRIPALLDGAEAQTALVQARVRGNLTALHRMLEEDGGSPISVLRAEGGWNVLLRVPAVIDEDELVLSMIREHGLTGQPGYFFDMPSNGYLAVSLLPEPEEFERHIRQVIETVSRMLG